MADITIKNEGSVILITPRTPEGREWVDSNLALESWQWLGDGFAVDSRYVEDIIDGMRNDGLDVQPEDEGPEYEEMSPGQEARLKYMGIIPPKEMQAAKAAKVVNRQQSKPLIAPQRGPGGKLDISLPPQNRHTVIPELPQPDLHLGSAKTAKDAYCDACDRPESQCICDKCHCDLTRKGSALNIKTNIGAAKSAAEAKMAKTSRELLREKISAMTTQRRKREYARMREVAAKNPQEFGAALTELVASLNVMAESMDSFQDNLNLGAVPTAAAPTVVAAAQKKYGTGFRQYAEHNPEVVADALNELYNSLDEIAAGVENLATHLGVELTGPGEEMEGMEGLEAEGEALETPMEQAHEEAEGIEGTEGDIEQDIALAEGKEAGKKEATGSGGFVTDRDPQAKPKAVEKAKVPESQGEAAIKASASKEAFLKRRAERRRAAAAA